MITTSHAVINAFAVHRPDVQARLTLRERRAFIVGGIAPDIALYVLNLAAIVYYPLVDGLSLSEAHQRGMDDLYFNSPWWIVGHNVLHAPLLLVAAFAGAALITSPWRRCIRCFVAGALLHSLIDIAVHHDDGPLVFFPVSWSIRFASPVSYWDPEHFGLFMRPLDLVITATGVVWLMRWWRTRSTTRSELTESV